MRTIALLALSLLAACSGGGGSSSSFTPAADLSASHQWLMGFWFGEFRPNGGVAQGGSLNFNTAMPAGSQCFPTFLTAANGFENGQVVLEADGNRVRFNVTIVGGGLAAFTGDVEGGFRMRLAWKTTAPGTAFDGQTGTALLERSGGPATVTVTQETFDVDGTTVVVRREWR